MNILFTPIKIGDIEIKNRFVMAPMCQWSADDKGHIDNFHHIPHYSARAAGGVGLIIIEATGVENAGRISDNCLGIWDDSHIEGLKKVTTSIKKYGAKAAIQLQHAGRKCAVTSVDKIIAPSPIAFDETYRTPAEMSKEDIKRVIDLFGNAAKRAKEADFDIVEVHAAHGYLLSTFLSPLTNLRTDEYGGSPENRTRIVLEVIEAVRKNFGDNIIIRVSAEDYENGGNTATTMAEHVQFFKDKVKMIDVSTGGVVPMEKRSFYPGYQIEAASIIKNITGTSVIAGGLLWESGLMEYTLRENKADMIFIGRELFRNPYFVLSIAKELGEKIEVPKQYEVAM